MCKLTLYEMNDTKRIKKKKNKRFYWAAGCWIFFVDICVLNPVFHKQCSWDTTDFNWRLWSVFQWSVSLVCCTNVCLSIVFVFWYFFILRLNVSIFFLSYVSKCLSVVESDKFGILCNLLLCLTVWHHKSVVMIISWAVLYIL